MTLTDLPAPNGHRSGYTDEEARERARADYQANRTLTGRELGVCYPRPDGTARSEEWGRKQQRAVRAHAAPTPAPVRTGTPSGTPTGRRGGTKPNRSSSGTARGAGTPSVPLIVLAACANVMVAVVAAVSSYTHIRDLAVTHGMGDLAGWLPLGVDGLVVACSCSVLVDRRANASGSLLAWAGLAIGLVGSVAANVMAAPADPVSRVLAAYPPVALAVSGHLLFRMLGDR